MKWNIYILVHIFIKVFAGNDQVIFEHSHFAMNVRPVEQMRNHWCCRMVIKRLRSHLTIKCQISHPLWSTPSVSSIFPSNCGDLWVL